MKTHIADAQDDWPFADWIVKARSRAAGGPWGSSVSLTRSVSGGRNGVLVDVSAMGVNPATTAVEVDLEWKTLQGSYTGDATYKPNVFIAVGVPRSKQSKSKTVAHEIGHGIGMVPTVGHALQYDNANGGMGSHCRHGAKQSDKSKAQGGTFTGTYTDGTCVMYAFSSEHYKFCPTCVEHVRSAQMFKRDMKARGWG
jgi:hypothetical protein